MKTRVQKRKDHHWIITDMDENNSLSSQVSIVLPAYNEEHSIGNTVREIKELYPDIEILVIDDGSTDNTAQQASNDTYICSHDNVQHSDVFLCSNYIFDNP